MNLVANTRDDDAWMIAIAAHCIAHVKRRPVVEEEMIIVRILRHRPTTEYLVHDEEPQSTTKIEKLGRGWMGRGANRIHAQLFKRQQPPLPNSQWHGRTDAPAVMVQAYAF